MTLRTNVFIYVLLWRNMYMIDYWYQIYVCSLNQIHLFINESCSQWIWQAHPIFDLTLWDFRPLKWPWWRRETSVSPWPPLRHKAAAPSPRPRVRRRATQALWISCEWRLWRSTTAPRDVPQGRRYLNLHDVATITRSSKDQCNLGGVSWKNRGR